MSAQLRPRSGLSAAVLVACATVAAVVAAYLAWLGWHAPYTVEAGNETGPYEATQVVGFALTWIAILVAATWATAESRAVWVTTTSLVVVWCADTGTRRTDDGSLWPLSAILLAGAVAIVGVLVARATTRVQTITAPSGWRASDEFR